MSECGGFHFAWIMILLLLQCLLFCISFFLGIFFAQVRFAFFVFRSIFLQVFVSRISYSYLSVIAYFHILCATSMLHLRLELVLNSGCMLTVPPRKDFYLFFDVNYPVAKLILVKILRMFAD